MKLEDFLPTISEATNYDAIDPLDSRYFDSEIARLASERSRIAVQAFVEAALAQTLADYGICSQKIADEITVAAKNVKAEDVYAEEKTTRHDIKALVNCIKNQIDDESKPFVHFGATSYDIIATANAIQMKTLVSNAVIPAYKQLLNTLIEMSEEYAGTRQVGRTHGQHAVPITFGFAISEYVERLGASLEAINDLNAQINGKFSGAVGAYNALSVFISDPLEFEEAILKKVDLAPASYSTQIIPPEQMIRLLDEIAVSAGIMANLANDMRHLQRSEISEVREKFEKGQTGSSTMAHKRNPWNFENVVSMSKQILAQTLNANLNVSSEHQRDLTDSASSRFYILAPVILSNMLKRLQNIMSKLEVDKEAMERNLKMSAGAIAAEPLYLLFEKNGHIAAHEKAKELAHAALEKRLPLAEVIQADPEAATYWKKFSQEEKDIITAPEQNYTGLAQKKAELIAYKWRGRTTN